MLTSFSQFLKLCCCFFCHVKLSIQWCTLGVKIWQTIFSKDCSPMEKCFAFPQSSLFFAFCWVFLGCGVFGFVLGLFFFFHFTGKSLPWWTYAYSLFLHPLFVCAFCKQNPVSHQRITHIYTHIYNIYIYYIYICI